MRILEPTPRRDGIVLAGLLLVAGAVHVAWTAADQVPTPTGDSYYYLRNLLRFLDGLGERPLSNLWNDLGWLSLVGRPPVYQLSTAPSVVLVGRSEDAALTVNVLYMALLAFATYRMGVLAAGRGAGLAAAVLVLAYPPVAGLSRMYLPHFATCAWVALTLWMLMSLLERRRIRTAWWLGFFLAAGLLNHPYFAWVVAVPTLAAGVYLLLFQTEPKRPASWRRTPRWLARKATDRFVVAGLLPAAVLAVTPAAVWYSTWGLRALDQMRRMRGRGVDHTNGFFAVENDFWWYAKTAPGALSNVLTALLAVGAVLALRGRRPPALLLWTALLSAYPIFSRMPIKGWWYFAAVLPVAAVLTAAGLRQIRPAWLARAALAAAVACAILSFSLVTWGSRPWAGAAAAALGSPLADGRTCGQRENVALCPDAARARDWPWDEIVGAALSAGECSPDAPCEVFFPGIYLSAAAYVDFLVTRDRIADRVRVRGLTGGRPYDFDALLGSEFIVAPEEGPVPRYRVHFQATLDFLRDPPEEFRRAHRALGTFDFPAPVVARTRLIQRVAPLSLEEVEAAAKALRLPAGYAWQTKAALAKAHATAGDGANAVRFYREIRDRNSRLALRNFLLRKFLAHRQHEAFVELSREALAEDPGDDAERTRLADVYRRSGDYGSARREILRVLEREPSDIRALRVLGDVYRDSGELRQAIATYQGILELDPEDAVTSRRLAHALRRLGDDS